MAQKISIDTLHNRRARLEREKAMNAARSPKDSKFGECLLNMNTKADQLLYKDLGRISSEYKRMELKLKQLKQTFVRQSKFLNHEPLILVERPASPEVRRRKVVMDMGAEDPVLENIPGYMRPLKSRSRTPSTLTTIDAFMVRSKKKRNVWEEAMDEKERPQFQSTVRPCSRLTQRDITEIHFGWVTHKTKLEKDERRSPSPTRATPKSLPPESYTFITQLPPPQSLKSADSRRTRSVRFQIDESENYPPSISSVGSKPKSKKKKLLRT